MQQTNYNMEMNRIKLLIVVLFATILCNAQVTVSTSQLNGTEWELVSRTILNEELYPDEGDVTTVTFTMSAYCDSCYYGLIDMDRVLRYSYYISNTIPSYTYFDNTKVGVNSIGKYIVEYNDIRNEVDYYTILSFNNDEMLLFHKAKEGTIPGYDVYVKYKRKEKE